MWAWMRRRSRPASQASATSRARSSAVASASAMRVGPWLEPFRKSRSPLTLVTHDRMRTWRRPVRSRRSSDTPPPSSAGRRTCTCRSWRVGSPRARGHHRSGCSTVRVHSTSLAPAASGWSAAWSSAPRVLCRLTVRAASLSSVARSTRTARSGVASRHSARRRAMRTGPVSVTRTGRHTPPGFQSGSRQSQCWKTPVMLRFAVRSVGRRARDLHREVVLAAGAQRLGDLEGVRGEVALGVAEVAAVEPHVALVEDPVEGQPCPATLGWPHRVEGPAVQQRAVRIAERWRAAPVPGDRRWAPRRRPRSRPRARCGAGRRPPLRRARSPSAPWSRHGTGRVAVEERGRVAGTLAQTRR